MSTEKSAEYGGVRTLEGILFREMIHLSTLKRLWEFTRNEGPLVPGKVM